MDEIGQLRIYVSEKYFSVYHKISGYQLFKQNSEFFIYCAFVGEKYKKKSLLKQRRELCRAITLSSHDQTAIKALYLKEYQNLSSIKEMVRLAEEYANGGMEYLIEYLLSDYLIEDDNGHYSLKSGVQSELQLALMSYVLKEKQEIPF